MKMREYIALAAGILMATTSLSAQQKYRAELNRFTTREAAVAGFMTPSNSKTIAMNLNYVAPTTNMQGSTQVQTHFTIPGQWSDDRFLLHLEGAPAPYSVYVNGKQIAQVEDVMTPQQIDITSAVTQNSNQLDLVYFTNAQNPLNGVDGTVGDNFRDAPFEGSYIYAQSALAVIDYVAEIVATDRKNEALLQLDVVVHNNYRTDKEMEVCIDITAPNGKLLDFYSIKEVIPAHSTDTVRFSAKVTAPDDFKWGIPPVVPMRKSVGTLQAPLYSVTIFTREGSIPRDYIMTKIAYRDIAIDGKAITNFGEPISIVTRRANAGATKAATTSQLTALRNEGVTTLLPDYAQPNYYYEVASQLGLFVIDAVSIAEHPDSEVRAVGGAPANDPRHTNDYLERGKSAYYRSRNYPCVVGYSLGGDSGSGYNTYRLYELLKELNSTQPVIYKGARGEWNNDVIEGLE